MQNKHTHTLTFSLSHTLTHTQAGLQGENRLFSRRAGLRNPTASENLRPEKSYLLLNEFTCFWLPTPWVPPLACLSACMSVSPFKDISRGVSDSNHWLLLSLCCCHYNKSIFMSHSITVSLNFSGCLCLSEREEKKWQGRRERRSNRSVYASSLVFYWQHSSAK